MIYKPPAPGAACLYYLVRQLGERNEDFERVEGELGRPIPLSLNSLSSAVKQGCCWFDFKVIYHAHGRTEDILDLKMYSVKRTEKKGDWKFWEENKDF